MIFWIILGGALGYFFKPQIDKLINKGLQKLRDKRGDDL